MKTVAGIESWGEEETTGRKSRAEGRGRKELGFHVFLRWVLVDSD